MVVMFMLSCVRLWVKRAFTPLRDDELAALGSFLLSRIDMGNKSLDEMNCIVLIFV